MRPPERAEATVDAGTPEETAPPAAPVTDGMTVPLVEPARPEGAISPLRLYQDPEKTLAEATGSLKAELERVTQSAEPVRARRRVTLAKPGDASTDTPGGGAVGSADPEAASLLPSSELKAKIASLAGAVERSRGYWQEPATPSEDIGTIETETPPVPDSDPDLHGAVSVSGARPGVTEDRGLNGNVDVPKPEQPMNNAFDGYDGVDLEEAFIDEETLRQMVAEIVREELRGALGSRITRNMRKLVRQEIQRMLEAPTRDTSE
ncbi:hypothetical protein [Chachezhania antarctica]|uniref:hypothetical protein n=1 Tax=Chachezhania antarctica TaxID=2340860 RepID=UPI0013CEAE98|nr:hypothetical protein [Chachezhania antarctica]